MGKIHNFYSNENINILFWEEAYKSFYEEKTILHIGKLNNREDIINMIIDKLNIQKITKSEKVIGYENLITSLKGSNEKEIRMINMYCDNFMFILFVNMHNQIIAILKSQNSNTIKIINFIKEYKEYKDIDYLFFNKGLKTEFPSWSERL